MGLILLILLILLLCGGLGYGYRGGQYGYHTGGVVGIVLIIVLVLLLTRAVPLI
jgi:hypothetical protein